MKEQVVFCEAIIADLARRFPDYPPPTSNASTVRLGGLLTITAPAEVIRKLIDAA